MASRSRARRARSKRSSRGSSSSGSPASGISRSLAATCLPKGLRSSRARKSRQRAGKSRSRRSPRRRRSRRPALSKRRSRPRRWPRRRLLKSLFRKKHQLRNRSRKKYRLLLPKCPCLSPRLRPHPLLPRRRGSKLHLSKKRHLLLLHPSRLSHLRLRAPWPPPQPLRRGRRTHLGASSRRASGSESKNRMRRELQRCRRCRHGLRDRGCARPTKSCHRVRPLRCLPRRATSRGQVGQAAVREACRRVRRLSGRLIRHRCARI